METPCNKAELNNNLQNLDVMSLLRFCNYASLELNHDSFKPIVKRLSKKLSNDTDRLNLHGNINKREGQLYHDILARVAQSPQLQVILPKLFSSETVLDIVKREDIVISEYGIYAAVQSYFAKHLDKIAPNSKIAIIKQIRWENLGQELITCDYGIKYPVLSAKQREEINYNLYHDIPLFGYPKRRASRGKQIRIIDGERRAELHIQFYSKMSLKDNESSYELNLEWNKSTNNYLLTFEWLKSRADHYELNQIASNGCIIASQRIDYGRMHQSRRFTIEFNTPSVPPPSNVHSCVFVFDNHREIIRRD